MKKIITVIVSLFILSGCASLGDLSVQEHNKSERVRKSTSPYAFTGTEFPLSKGYSITAHLVAVSADMDIVAELKECDLAIVKGRNELVKPIFSDAQSGEDVTIYGYIRSVPNTVAVKPTDVANINSKYLKDTCEVMYTDVTTKQGMSGSPLINKDGSIVGVFVAIEDRIYKRKDGSRFTESRGVFVPYQSFKPWLEANQKYK